MPNQALKSLPRCEIRKEMDRQKKLLLHISPVPIDCLLIPSCMVSSLVYFTRIIHRAYSLCLQGLAYSLWLTIFNTGTLCMDFSYRYNPSVGALLSQTYPGSLSYKTINWDTGKYSLCTLQRSIVNNLNIPIGCLMLRFQEGNCSGSP